MSIISSFSVLLTLVSLIVFYAVPKGHQWKVLLAASFLYFAMCSPIGTGVVIVCSLVSYFAAKAFSRISKRSGKRALLALIVWNGLALGVIGALQQVTHASGPLWLDEGIKGAYFFSTFGYPNMAGDYFTTLFGLSIGLWRWQLDDMRRKEIPGVR